MGYLMMQDAEDRRESFFNGSRFTFDRNSRVLLARREAREVQFDHEGAIYVPEYRV